MSYNNAGLDTFPFSLTLTQPETIQFLFLSSGIILIVGGVVALKNFGRAPILLSKIAFTFFYFLGPLAYFFFGFGNFGFGRIYHGMNLFLVHRTIPI